MSINTHLDSLHQKHAQLEQLIHEAYVHHQPTAELKRKKLTIKDEIQHYEALLAEGHTEKQAA